ncbi:hypothetical protein BDW22DRAFT_902886 [Trametopsis cervina]|nr:hypothetical protein BDW22DRAFT_902886 [Trametopsis cervina]
MRQDGGVAPAHCIAITLYSATTDTPTNPHPRINSKRIDSSSLVSTHTRRLALYPNIDGRRHGITPLRDVYCPSGIATHGRSAWISIYGDSYDSSNQSYTVLRILGYVFALIDPANGSVNGGRQGAGSGWLLGSPGARKGRSVRCTLPVNPNTTSRSKPVPSPRPRLGIQQTCIHTSSRYPGVLKAL